MWWFWVFMLRSWIGVLRFILSGVGLSLGMGCGICFIVVVEVCVWCGLLVVWCGCIYCGLI